ncbi:MAG: methyltransferase domain-containing protein [Alphaproteobacteria bacterium]|nr:methyltransferase domain-containing protein [Alphaproteobacteria bacterium]
MSGTSYDPAAFHQFEHEGWERLSDGYHRHWEALTTQAVPRMLAGTEVAKGMRVLDVACGPGYVSGAAAAWGAATVGVDFSQNMVALAQNNFSELDFQTADAEDLPFPDGSFDVVLINFGVLHFPTPEKALAEAFRVLKADGKLALTNWAKSDTSAITIAMKAIIKEGALDIGLPEGTPLYRFADPDECESVLGEVGFSDIVCSELELTWRLPESDTLMDTFSQATARMSGLLRAQDPDRLPVISAAMEEGCAPYHQCGVRVLPMPALLTIATKV